MNNLTKGKGEYGEFMSTVRWKTVSSKEGRVTWSSIGTVRESLKTSDPRGDFLAWGKSKAENTTSFLGVFHSLKEAQQHIESHYESVSNHSGTHPGS